MYSKNKGFGYQQASFTPPPGYDGSRFRGRSDGRDDSFPLYESQVRPQKRILTQRTSEPPHIDRIDQIEQNSNEAAVCTLCERSEDEETNKNSCRENSSEVSPMSLLAPILKRIGKEELLIIALIIILAGERDCLDTDTILLLALLLCAG